MSSLGTPTVPWVLEIVGPVVFAGFIAWVILNTRRSRRLSLVSLALIAGTSMWWQEWYGDWGSYLLYNPHFALLPWHHTPWTTPNKPWFVIPAYGWYYAIIFPLMLAIIGRVRRARPAWNRLRWKQALTAVVVSLILFYAWDLTVEGAASALGWWSYTHPIGPTLNSTKGTFPLAFPILLFCLFGVVVTWIIDQRDDLGRFRFEVAAGTYRLAAGWKREVARAGLWIVMMNLAYIVCLIGPLIIWRHIGGPSSVLVP